MSDAAYRWRKARARDSAIRELKRQGFNVWDVTRGSAYSTIVAYNPDGAVCREIIVCLDSTSMKSLGKLHRRRGVSLEVWHRNRGETTFSITKL